MAIPNPIVRPRAAPIAAASLRPGGPEVARLAIVMKLLRREIPAMIMPPTEGTMNMSPMMRRIIENRYMFVAYIEPDVAHARQFR